MSGGTLNELIVELNRQNDDLRTALAAKERENGELREKLNEAAQLLRECHERHLSVTASRDEAFALLRKHDEPCFGGDCAGDHGCLYHETRAFLATERT